MPLPHSLFAERVLLPGGWRHNVCLHWNEDGRLTSVDTDTTAPAGVPRADGPVLPGMCNLHSHAFQRAMAGLTEYLGHPQDSFWSWRELMYRFAARLTPDTLYAVARQLYVEMLKAGYTSVCEFHYVHHHPDGTPYPGSTRLAEQLVRAAADAGIGLTLLPVLYQHSGFGAQAPLPQQARFIANPDWILDLLARLRQDHPAHDALRYGVAPHSLRAVAPAALDALRAGLHADDPLAPIHIHIAEQTREVEDAVAHLGARPVRWLLDHQPVDTRWCLVHATHMTPDETAGLKPIWATGCSMRSITWRPADAGALVLTAMSACRRLRSCACSNMASVCAISAATHLPARTRRQWPTGCTPGRLPAARKPPPGRSTGWPSGNAPTL
jgi:formimidoylglutamate deiminase